MFVYSTEAVTEVSGEIILYFKLQSSNMSSQNLHSLYNKKLEPVPDLTYHRFLFTDDTI